jgi:hypothetical protein
MWQRLMIYLARNKSIKTFFQNKKILSELANRFVGGRNEEEALIKYKDLINENVYSSLYYLNDRQDKNICCGKYMGTKGI